MFNRKSVLLINNFFIYYINLNFVETEFINFLSNIKIFFLRTLRFCVNFLIKILFVFEKSIIKDSDYDIKSLSIKSIEYSRRLLMSLKRFDD